MRPGPSADDAPELAARSDTAHAVVLGARGMTKRFPGGVTAVRRVDLDLVPGEVHALLGENGAGKSTVAALLAGLHRPDEGTIEMNGTPMSFRGPRDALRAGIGIVHQHFRLVERFTVAENIALGDRGASRRLRLGAVEAKVRELGERYGLAVDPKARVGELTVGERQRVEIVKVLARDVQVLLLDEPTAVLTPQEVEALLATIRAMAGEGRSVVFISHKLDEVAAVADRVTVLRDGEVVGQATGALEHKTLAELMFDRPISLDPVRASRPPWDIGLSIAGVSYNAGGIEKLSGIDVEVRRGEIVGIAGVAGNGQRELAEVAAGVRSPTAGTVRVGGIDVTGLGPRKVRAKGLAFVPEDRLGTGLVPDMSLVDNFLLTGRRRFVLDRRAAARELGEAIERYDVKVPDRRARTGVLSGGNAQKLLLARELLALDRGAGPQVLVVASPTRGLDVSATEMIRTLLHELRERGGAVLLFSEDLDEIRSLADRLAVLHRGRIVLGGMTDELGIDRIGLAMAGGHS